MFTHNKYRDCSNGLCCKIIMENYMKKLNFFLPFSPRAAHKKKKNKAMRTNRESSSTKNVCAAMRYKHTYRFLHYSNAQRYEILAVFIRALVFSHLFNLIYYKRLYSESLIVVLFDLVRWDFSCGAAY